MLILKSGKGKVWRTKYLTFSYLSLHLMKLMKTSFLMTIIKRWQVLDDRHYSHLYILLQTLTTITWTAYKER